MHQHAGRDASYCPNCRKRSFLSSADRLLIASFAASLISSNIKRLTVCEAAGLQAELNSARRPGDSRESSIVSFSIQTTAWTGSAVNHFHGGAGTSSEPPSSGGVGQRSLIYAAVNQPIRWMTWFHLCMKFEAQDTYRASFPAVGSKYEVF